jgi:hypothetical protein
MIHSFIDFEPPPAVYTAMIAGLSIIVFLILLSHGPFKFGGLGRRFRVAVFLSLALWVALLWLTGALVPLDSAGVMDLAAGAFVVATAIIAGFTAWSLLAWGFMLSILLSLAHQDGVVGLEDWMSDYGGGRGLDSLLSGRLELLFRLGMVVRDGDRILLTPRGAFTGRVARFYNFFFALRKAG